MKGTEAPGEGRGLVLAVEGREAVVLTPAGEFRRVPLDRPDRRVGEEMPLALPPARRWLPALSGLAVAAAVLLAVALSGLRGGPPQEGDTPSLLVEAYVSVDINPSLELGVGKDAAVVEGRPLNEDGRRLLAAVPHRGRPLAQVLAALVREAARAGYLIPGRSGEVVIAAAPARAGGVSPAVVEAVQRGEAAARSFLREEGVRASVYAVRVGRAELRREAGSLGLSVGKYLVMKELEDAGLTVAPDELQRVGLGRVLRERGLKPGELLQRAARDARREIELIDEDDSVGVEVGPGHGGPEETRGGGRDGEDFKEREDGKDRPFEVRPDARGFPGFRAPGPTREDGEVSPGRAGGRGEGLRREDEGKADRDNEGRRGERGNERRKEGPPEGREGEDLFAAPTGEDVPSGVYGGPWMPTDDADARRSEDAFTENDREGDKAGDDKERKDKKEDGGKGHDGEED